MEDVKTVFAVTDEFEYRNKSKFEALFGKFIPEGFFCNELDPQFINHLVYPNFKSFNSDLVWNIEIMGYGEK